MVVLMMPNPERFWFADRSSFSALADPDVEDGYQRHDDRCLVDWSAVAAAVQTNGERLVSGSTHIDSDGDQVFKLDLEGLGQTEATIVQSWFARMIDCPRGDPGDEVPSNGRHRLWCSWEANPDALLPVYSETLGYEADAESSPGMEQAMKAEATRIVAACPSAVAERSPLYWQRIQRWI